MNFWGMGTGEIVLILVVALIILGPGRATEVGRTLGRMVRTLKKATSDLTAQINKETEEQGKKPATQERMNDQL